MKNDILQKIYKGVTLGLPIFLMVLVMIKNNIQKIQF